MKKIIIQKAFFVLLCVAIMSCTQNDDLETRAEFLHAQVNKEYFSADRETGILLLQKQLTDRGTINLLVSGQTREGKAIELLIHNYDGEKRYEIGRKNSINQVHYLNSNRCQYLEETTGLFWSTFNNNQIAAGLPGYIEISEDNGSIISGNFAFDAFDMEGINARNVSEGNFSIKLQH